MEGTNKQDGKHYRNANSLVELAVGSAHRQERGVDAGSSGTLASFGRLGLALSSMAAMVGNVNRVY